MLRRISIILIVVFALSVIAFADSTNYSYTLSNGVNGKRETDYVLKTTATGTSAKTTISSISGATASYPMVARVRAAGGGQASELQDHITTTTTYYFTWKDGYGSYGKNYKMRMQNTTNGPTITVSGTFTP